MNPKTGQSKPVRPKIVEVPNAPMSEALKAAIKADTAMRKRCITYNFGTLEYLRKS